MEIPKMKSNYGLGPRLGNESARADKRETFREGKMERSNLADSINKAFTARTVPPVIDSRLESVAATVKPKKFKR
jgi:hypothetical protein